MFILTGQEVETVETSELELSKMVSNNLLLLSFTYERVHKLHKHCHQLGITLPELKRYLIKEIFNA